MSKIFTAVRSWARHSQYDWKVTIFPAVFVGANASFTIFMVYNHSINLPSYVDKFWRQYQ